MTNQSTDETADIELDQSVIEDLKKAASEHVREQWIQHNFEFDEPRTEVTALQNEYAPAIEEPSKPSWATSIVISALAWGGAVLALSLFPDVTTEFSAYLVAFGISVWAFGMQDKDSKQYSKWITNERLREEIAEIFLEEAQKVHRQALSRLSDAEPPTTLTDQQINSLFAPPAVVDCTPRQAEFWARDWLRFLGVEDAQVTQASQDGGIDVTSKDYVAQVKHYLNPVGPAPVREIAGVANALLKQPIFFARSGYTKTARDFGQIADVILFSYDADQGELKAETPLAQRVLANGLDKDWR